MGNNIKSNKDKIKYLEESRNLIKNKDKIIKNKKRKKIAIKILFFAFLILAVITTLMFKLSYFNVKYIDVQNNSNIPKYEIIKLSKLQEGCNIFNINKEKVKKNILVNPYILNVNVKRKLPNKIILNVSERKAVFYIKDSYNNYYVIDKNSVILEKKSNIDTMNLIELAGYKGNNFTVGDKLSFDDNRKLKLISEITELMSRNISGIKLSVLDISKIYDINAYYKNICIKIGQQNNLEEKFNKAFSILKTQNLYNKKGYIDVSFKGNPVFRLEK